MVRGLKPLSYKDRQRVGVVLWRASSGLLIIKGGLQERWRKTSGPVMTG